MMRWFRRSRLSYTFINRNFVKDFTLLSVTFTFLMVFHITISSEDKLENDRQSNLKGRLFSIVNQNITKKQIDHWQPVFGTRSKFFVFSAYLEQRTVKAVRIIAATRTHGADKVFCRLRLPDERTLTLNATVKPIRENWSLNYSAAFVLCLLNGSKVDPRETVGGIISVIPRVIPKLSGNQIASNLLLVKDTKPKAGIQDILNICVKPFHFKYHSLWLVEWIEQNRLLGVSHFYMYNKSLSHHAGCVLGYYQKQGLITLLPWKLPIQSQKEIRTEGMFAAFNDCLYRSMSRAGWLMPIDTDEVVFPRRARTIPDMLTVMSTEVQHVSKTPAAFLFRNAFFYTLWKDDISLQVSLLTSRKTQRLKSLHAFKNRSKYVVRPQHAVELGNHFPWEYVPGSIPIGVPSSIAILHHYRENCEYGDRSCLSLKSVIDRTAHAWTETLWKRVRAEQEQIDKICS